MQKTKHSGIYALEDGRYRLRVTATNPDTGSREDRQETMPHGTTIEEAIQRREEIREDIKTRAPVDVPPALQNIDTVGEYALWWLDIRGPDLATRTLEQYGQALDMHILPYIGDVKVENLARRHAQHLVRKMDEATKENGKTYARATRRSWWRVAKVVLDDLAADFGLACPTRRVRPPQVDGGNHRAQECLSLSEMQTLVETTSVLEGQRYREVLTLATTGMRVGELYGLQWPDIDYERGIIHIRRSATNGNLRKYTKTKATREVPLAPKVSHELRQQHKELLSEGHPGLELQLVFPSNAGTARYGGSLRKVMRRLTEAMRQRGQFDDDKSDDFYLTPQVLRRSVNTLCVQTGVDQIVTRSILGHADEQMTELYAGVGVETKRQTLRGTLGALFEDV